MRVNFFSIRTRLLVWLTIPLIIFLAIDALANYRAALGTAQLAYDRLLVTSAHAIADLIRLERGKLVISLPHAALEIYGDSAALGADAPRTDGRMQYRIGFVDGSYLAGDAELPPFKGRPVSHPVYHSMIELYDMRNGDEQMRGAALLQPVESFDGARLVIVQVAESARTRNALGRKILQDTLMRQAALLAVVLALIWVVGTLALRPLEVLASRLEARKANDLTPLPYDMPATELQPLIGGFNSLLARLSLAQDQQRRFVADASHQLRTPLTVLQLHADAGLRGDIAPMDALALVANTTQRATRLADQLLSLARAQAAHGERPESFDLRELASEVAVELSPLIAARFLDFHFECDSRNVVSHRWMVREITTNLLKNAIGFTPPRGSLGLRIEQTPSTTLVVWDTGPGLSPAMAELVFKPFATDRPSQGAGLGLAICHDLALASGATLELKNRGGPLPEAGLEARLIFPGRLGPEAGDFADMYPEAEMADTKERKAQELARISKEPSRPWRAIKKDHGL